MIPLNLDLALAWTASMASVATLVATLELLVRRAWLADDQLLSWPASRLRYRFLSMGWTGLWFDRALRTRVFLFLLVLRLGIAVAVPFATGRWRGGLLLALAILFALWALRSPYGQDGADQMTLLLTVSVALGDLVGTPASKSMVATFIGAQLTLSYFVAGAAKAMSELWRSGDALMHVFRTRIYGNAWVYEWIQDRRWLARGACWTVFLLEVAFPVWIAAPWQVGLALGCAMAGFHLASACLMGLNTFLLAFLGAYPCWLWLLLSLRHAP